MKKAKLDNINQQKALAAEQNKNDNLNGKIAQLEA